MTYGTAPAISYLIKQLLHSQDVLKLPPLGAMGQVLCLHAVHTRLASQHFELPVADDANRLLLKRSVKAHVLLFNISLNKSNASVT